MTSNQIDFPSIELKDGGAMGLGDNLAKNVKAIRLKQGFSQQQLSKKTGLTVRYISRLENTAPNVTLDALEKLAMGLNCSPIELIRDEKWAEASSKKTVDTIDQTIKFLQSLKSRM